MIVTRLWTVVLDINLELKKRNLIYMWTKEIGGFGVKNENLIWDKIEILDTFGVFFYYDWIILKMNCFKIFLMTIFVFL